MLMFNSTVLLNKINDNLSYLKNKFLHFLLLAFKVIVDLIFTLIRDFKK
jgi:hypothetical protein